MSSIGLVVMVGLAAAGPFGWSYGPPLVEARAVGGWDWISVKDPSIVRHQDRWHLFCTMRGPKRSHAIVYLNFGEFSEANQAERHVLSCHLGYFCAPQMFYFTPQQRWYLICRAADEAWGEPAYRPAFSTTADVANPDDAFASIRNATPKAQKWSDVISYGELLRGGYDERLETGPANLRFLFQGVLDAERQGKNYGEIPWRLGLLEFLR